MWASRSLPLWGLLALLIGILTGLFLGPSAATFLLPFANAFSMLLEMAVFPYICLSLILGMALSHFQELFLLFKRGWKMAIGLWAAAIFFIFFLTQIIPEAFPPIYSADQMHKTRDALEILITYLSPENGLNALANNQILAGISFSLLFGAALMQIEKKEFLIPYLEKSLKIIEKIFKWIRLFSPIGVFLYIAIAFASIDIGDLWNIKEYLLARVFICFLFSCLFIPFLLSYLLKLSLRQIYHAMIKSCFLPFLCGSAPLLIPFLIQYRDEEGFGKKSSSDLFVLIPISYSFMQVGSAIVIFLSAFLSFYYRFSLSFLEQILIYFLFVPISFGDPTTPFSSTFFITHFNLPITESQVDAETALFIHHFLILMSAVSILSFLLWMRLPHKLKRKKLILFSSTISFLFIIGIYAIKPFIHMRGYYEGVYQTRKISDVIPDPVQSSVVLAGEGGAPRDPNVSRLQQIIESGVLKVGIEEYVMPYSYLNDSNELVGYDIAYAYQLARDLDCTLQFVLADVNRLREELDAGDFDLGMASFLMTENRLKEMEFTEPSFQQEDNVLIVPRAQKGEFIHLEEVQKRPLKLLTEGAYSEIAKLYFPNAEIISARGNSLLKNHEVDGCFWTRTSGFVWCILNPEFVVIDYGSLLGNSYLAYPIRENSFEFVSFLNNWLQVKEQNGFKNKMINYWIKGGPKEKRK